jgi:hypothetical protein
MGTYDIMLEEDGKKLIITFQGNLDLYWQMFSENKDELLTITITKENYAIYSVFERLFNDIKDCNVAKITYDSTNEVDEYEKERMLQEVKWAEEHNRDLKEYRKYDPESVFKGGTIEWHCDDEPYEESNVLTITKVNDEFKVHIAVPNKYSFNNNYVRIRNSGSRHSPYNQVFMRMFNELQQYDPQKHQIDIEELLYSKKKILKR